jgi:hypothetical protein
MSATARFYTGLVLVLAIIVGVSYYAGYRAGAKSVHAAHHVR